MTEAIAPTARRLAWGHASAQPFAVPATAAGDAVERARYLAGRRYPEMLVALAERVDRAADVGIHRYAEASATVVDEADALRRRALAALATEAENLQRQAASGRLTVAAIDRLRPKLVALDEAAALVERAHDWFRASVTALVQLAPGDPAAAES